MPIEDELAIGVIFLSAVSCIKWLHLFVRTREIKHLATSFIRVLFTVLYAWIWVTDMPADIARHGVRFLLIIWLFDEDVNWIGPWLLDKMADLVSCLKNLLGKMLRKK